MIKSLLAIAIMAITSAVYAVDCQSQIDKGQMAYPIRFTLYPGQTHTEVWDFGECTRLINYDFTVYERRESPGHQRNLYLFEGGTVTVSVSNDTTNQPLPPLQLPYISVFSTQPVGMNANGATFEMNVGLAESARKPMDFIIYTFNVQEPIPIP